MRRLSLIALVAAALTVSRISYSLDFSIREEATQQLNLLNVEQIVLTCHCVKTITVTKSKEAPAQIRFEGVLETVGYHGEGEKPKSILAELMVFEEKRSGKMLFLESKEWTLMHSVFLVREVELTIPQGVEVRTVTIPFEELEGRARIAETPN